MHSSFVRTTHTMFTRSFNSIRFRQLLSLNKKVPFPVLRNIHTKSVISNTTKSSNRYSFSIPALALLTTCSALYYTQLINNDNESSVKVHKSVDSFPKEISLNNNQTSFELSGYGIREVSFLKFQVYALGLYICKDDYKLIKEILNSKFIESFYDNIDCNDQANHKNHLINALADKEISNILIRNLINSGVKFTARICAIRNTDLSHLRDGFIRTIRNNPNYSKLMKDDDETIGTRITTGLDDLRDIFNSVKLNAKKNSLVLMQVDENQSIKVTVKTCNKKGDFNDEIVIGTVKEPLITELLFESYLGAEKPLIQQVQQLSAVKIAEIATC